ncbi:uncharacterized protein LOC144331889 [Macaca mulatta]
MVSGSSEVWVSAVHGSALGQLAEEAEAAVCQCVCTQSGGVGGTVLGWGGGPGCIWRALGRVLLQEEREGLAIKGRKKPTGPSVSKRSSIHLPSWPDPALLGRAEETLCIQRGGHVQRPWRGCLHWRGTWARVLHAAAGAGGARPARLHRPVPAHRPSPSCLRPLLCHLASFTVLPWTAASPAVPCWANRDQEARAILPDHPTGSEDCMRNVCRSWRSAYACGPSYEKDPPPVAFSARGDGRCPAPIGGINLGVPGSHRQAQCDPAGEGGLGTFLHAVPVTSVRRQGWLPGRGPTPCTTPGPHRLPVHTDSRSTPTPGPHLHGPSSRGVGTFPRGAESGAPCQDLLGGTSGSRARAVVDPENRP